MTETADSGVIRSALTLQLVAQVRTPVFPALEDFNLDHPRSLAFTDSGAGTVWSRDPVPSALSEMLPENGGTSVDLTPSPLPRTISTSSVVLSTPSSYVDDQLRKAESRRSNHYAPTPSTSQTASGRVVQHPSARASREYRSVQEQFQMHPTTKNLVPLMSVAPPHLSSYYTTSPSPSVSLPRHSLVHQQPLIPASPAPSVWHAPEASVESMRIRPLPAKETYEKSFAQTVRSSIPKPASIAEKQYFPWEPAFWNAQLRR